MFWSGLPAVQVFSLARYGVWLFLDQEHLFGGRVPIGFWEVLHQRPILMQCLQAYIASSPKPMTLHRYYGPTNPRSIRLSRNNLLWKSASCVSRKLDELHRVHSLGALMHVQDNGSSSEGGEAPSNLTLVRPIAKRVSTFLRNRVAERRYVNQWIIGYRFAAPSEALDVLDHNFAQYRLLIPPTDRYWADPFPVQHEGRYFLFFEEVLYSEAKGHLCVAEINDDGLAEQPRVLLKREYHMSYPFIFSWRQEWYLIPETQAANRIDVYKFDSFPYKASYCGTIMDNVNAVDATLLEADGRWWMFVAMAPEGTWNVDELFLFHAESPFGPWLPHRKNPIKSDVRSARPAGGILARKGKYYRPAQDCSYRYGYAVRFQEIELLSEADYLEREVGAVLPGWSPEILATHTVNAAGGLNVIDVQQQRRR
jgi:hypothetical protein